MISHNGSEYESYYQTLIWIAEQEALERERIKPEVLVSYFEQINEGKLVRVFENQALEEKAATDEMRRALASGEIRLKWTEDEQPPFIHKTDDGTDQFVEVLISGALYDLIARDSHLYYGLTRGLLGKGIDWVANRLGSLIGYEVLGQRASQLSLQEAGFLRGAVGYLVEEVLRQHLELLERMS